MVEPHNKRQRPNVEVDYEAGEMREIPIEIDSGDLSKHFDEDDLEFLSAESPRYTSDDQSSAWDDHAKSTGLPAPRSDSPYITQDEETPDHQAEQR